MKKQTIILFGVLLATMSSCVYSLFPIYTEDTVVFREELLGKWVIGDEGAYMLFETKEKKGKDQDYKYVIEVNEGLTLSSNDPIFIMNDGKQVFDKDSIISIMNKRMSKGKPKESTDRKTKDTKIGKELQEKITKKGGKLDYEGSVYVFEENSYELTIVDEEGKEDAYIAHLVDIKGNLFLDLYPIKDYDSFDFTDNYFPVHTFFKLAVTKSELTITHFDLDKLNKLFESNLIRLRHENVDGKILITAQSSELQKFIDRYSEDETVFDRSETYKKAS
ncbi:MAG: hypothetical protein AAF616_00220 [Bacteroidota bacterium]